MDNPHIPNLSEYLSSLNRKKFNDVCSNHLISYDYALRLDLLDETHVTIIIDDTDLTKKSNQPLREEITRFLTCAIDVVDAISEKGTDVYFLNRSPLCNLTSVLLQDTDPFDKLRLRESQSFVSIVEHLVSLPTDSQRLFIFIATDIITNKYGCENYCSVAKVISRCGPTDYVSIINANRQLYQLHPEVSNHYHNLLSASPNVRLIDDYATVECNHRLVGLKMARTSQQYPSYNASLTFGNYVVKAMMISVDTWFEMVDLTRLKPKTSSLRRLASRKSSKCETEMDPESRNSSSFCTIS